MRSFLASALIIAQCFCASGQTTQPPITQHTLLWRVQGKSLQKPCYLFGTMHLAIKRAFYFPDSLYIALENADGFAMEVHPDSLTGMIFRHAVEQSQQKMLKDVLSKAEMAKLNARVQKELGINADKLTAKDAFILKEKLSIPQRREDDMPAFMDAYLYSIARDRDKRIAGLERPEDQEALLSEMEGSFDPHTLTDDGGHDKKFTDNLIDVYCQANLPLVDSIMEFGSDSSELVSLFKRNRVMQRSMDSLFKTGTYFVAVGAAHLGGDSGLISLLRREGYLVSPVLSAKRAEPGSYVFSRGSEKEWTTLRSESDGYEAAFPGAAQDYAGGNGVQLKVYMDMTKNQLFECGAGAMLIQLTKTNGDSILEDGLKRMIQKLGAVTIKKTPIVQDSARGLEAEIYSKAQGLYMRTRFFVTDKHIYFVAMVGQDKAFVSGPAKDRFFGSFTMFAPQTGAAWHTMTVPDRFCSYQYPGRDNIQPTSGSLSNADVHTIIDPGTGNMFTATLSRAHPGFSLKGDSVSLYGTLERIKDVWLARGDSNIVTRDTVVLGCQSLWLQARLKDAFVTGYIIKRENYQYTLMGFSATEERLRPEWYSFMASFSLLPFGEMPVATETGPQGTYTVKAPDRFLANEDDPEEWRWVDTVRMETYSMSVVPLSPYAFASSDTAFLRRILFVSFGKKNAPAYTYTQRQGRTMLTFESYQENSGRVERGAYFLVGDKLYKQMAFLLPGRTHTIAANLFFDSLRLREPSAFRGFPAAGPAKLLRDLRTGDSATQAVAADYLDTAAFGEKDLPEALKTLSDGEPEGQPVYWSRRLKSAIRVTLTDRDLPQVGAAYRNLRPEKEERRYELLELASGLGTPAGVDTLLELLTFKRPTRGQSYSVMSDLERNPKLAVRILPGLLPFAGDSLLCAPLFSLCSCVLDSSSLALTDFATYERTLLDAGYGHLARYAGDTSDGDYNFWRLTDFLGRFRDTAARNFFRRALATGTPGEKSASVGVLIGMGDTLSMASVTPLAASPTYRLELYDTLSRSGRQAIFPPAYFTQRAFAECYLDEATSDEDDDSHKPMTFLREGVYTYQGKKAKFLLFSVRYTDSSYLGVVGPYPVGSKQVILDRETRVTGVYATRAIDTRQLDAEVREYLAGRATSGDDDD
ncbi:MAG TPA: TraB/GumN family protein [Dinghuibacter sp.]|uniref:TraB/GumN family protein n=1 Tax=Dinghuibacter sp. TaxID=2024697 RepID=UPI002B64AA2A|nr:TraB/GumN family protein [Dinghuibacter sp.]HTJ12749.1 TraB/GumN family protein [Dinghuibacter sp.]